MLLTLFANAGAPPPSAVWWYVGEGDDGMLLRTNVADQVVGEHLVNVADGAPFTGSAAVSVTIDNGAQAAGAGTVTHKGGGYHTYLPTQSETNGIRLAYTFSATGAVSRTVRATGVAFNPEDSTRLGLTALPNAAAEAVGGLYTRGTGVGQVNQPTAGQIDARATQVADKTGYAIGTGGIGAAAFAAGAIDAAALNASAVDKILDELIGDSGITMRQALKVVVAALVGKLSGVGTGTITIRNVADTTDVIVASVSGGNRTSVTLTL
jgi:hypothetical protein